MLRRVFRQYRDQRRVLFIIAALNTLAAGAEALALISIAPLIQAAADGSDSYSGSFGSVEIELSLPQLAAISGVLLVLNLGVTLLTTYVTSRLITGYRLRSRLTVVRAFDEAEWAVQAREREGWLLTLSTTNVEQASDGIGLLGGWIRGAIGLAVFIIGAMLVNFLAVLVLTGVLGVIASGLRPLSRYAERLSNEVSELNISLNEELSTLTSNSREFKAFGVVGAAGQVFRATATKERSLALRAEFAKKLASPIFRTCGSLLIVVLIAIAASRSEADVAAIGLVAVLLYRSFNYGTALVSVHQSLVYVTPWLDQLDRGVRKLEAGRAVLGAADPGPVRSQRVEQLTFRYPGASADALHDVTLQVDVGDVVGIVGPSGAGKSTLAELMLGLRDPVVGCVKLNDIDMKDVRPDLRAAAIGLVSQSVPIIPATLADNVRFFRSINDESIEQALKDAGLSALLRDLPEGIHTRIGPGARAVSGGQAQRIGIARAMAGAPAIVILDEPTSALDAATEQAVTDTIGRMRGVVGVVVIAHRLTTLRHCDRVAVLEGGELVDIGALDDVRERNAYLRHAFELGQLDWVR